MTHAVMSDGLILVGPHARRQKLIDDLKTKASSVPWVGVGGAVFWGSLGALSGLLAIDFFLMGAGPIGFFLGVVYTAFTFFDGFMVVTCLQTNSIFGF